MIKLCVIVAMAENNVIGRENDLPWRLPEDLSYFKRVTMGHPIIMGRKTFESIGRPLPGRENIVMTTQEAWSASGVDVVHGFEDALGLAKTKAFSDAVDKIMVIGGAELYKQALSRADILYLTEVHSVVEGDAYFPDLNREEWREISREKHDAGGGNPYAYSFVVLERC